MTEEIAKKNKKEALKKISEKASGLLYELITDIPGSLYTPIQNPDDKARLLAQRAAWKSATVSTSLSIPAGITGILTAVPDIAAIWKIQAQLVADIAACYGKLALLSREAMVWCLFRHSAASLLRDIAVRTGSRLVVQKLSSAAIKAILAKIGAKVSSKLLGKTLLRAIPAIGALGNGMYAFYDTLEVGKTAAAYFRALSDQETLAENEPPRDL
jgi:hypothetical protein